MAARHAGTPMRLGTRDAVTQHARVAGKEIDLVAHLQRQQVLRMAEAQVLEDAASPLPLAMGQCAGSGHVSGLALGGRTALGSGMRLARGRQAGRLGAQQVQVGHKHMGHRHVRRLLQRGQGLDQRVVDVAAQQRAGGLVVLGGVGIGPAQRVAVDVLDRHGESLARDGVESGFTAASAGRPSHRRALRRSWQAVWAMPVSTVCRRAAALYRHRTRSASGGIAVALRTSWAISGA